MYSAKNKPDFLTVWKSLKQGEKSKLIRAYTLAAGKNGLPISDFTFFRKNKTGNWTELEKNWWSNKLNYPIDCLFPEKKVNTQITK
jgi:hypothetical protein